MKTLLNAFKKYELKLEQKEQSRILKNARVIVDVNKSLDEIIETGLNDFGNEPYERAYYKLNKNRCS